MMGPNSKPRKSQLFCPIVLSRGPNRALNSVLTTETPCICRGPFVRTSVVSSSTQEAMVRREPTQVNAEEQMFAKQSAFQQEARISHEASFLQLWAHGQYQCGPWFSTQFRSSQPCVCNLQGIHIEIFRYKCDASHKRRSYHPVTPRHAEAKFEAGTERNISVLTKHLTENCGRKSKKTAISGPSRLFACHVAARPSPTRSSRMTRGMSADPVTKKLDLATVADAFERVQKKTPHFLSTRLRRSIFASTIVKM